MCESNKLSSSLGFFYIDICYICFQNNISIMIFGKMYFVPCLNRVNANVYLPYESLPSDNNGTDLCGCSITIYILISTVS